MLSARRHIPYYLPVVLCFSLPLSTSLTTISFLSLVAIWLLGGQYKQKLNYYWDHPLAPFLLSFLALTLVMGMMSFGSNEHVIERLRDTVRILCIPIIGYYIVSQRQMYLSFYAFILAMVITLACGVLKFYFGVPIGQKYTEAAVFKSHIDTSFFMSLAVFYTIFLACIQKKYRVTLSLLALMMLWYVFFMSTGRIGYLAVFAIGAYTAHHYFNKKGLSIAFVAIVVGAVCLYHFSDIFQHRLDILIQDWDYYKQNRLLESSLGSRIQFYQTSINLMSQKPILGWGTGAFGAAYAHISQGAYLFTDNPHNEFLRVGVELGTLGLGLLVALFVRIWQLYSGVFEHWRVLARGTFILFIIGCLLNSWLIDFSLSFFFVVFSAMSVSSYSSYKPGDLIQAPLH